MPPTILPSAIQWDNTQGLTLQEDNFIAFSRDPYDPFTNTQVFYLTLSGEDLETQYPTFNAKCVLMNDNTPSAVSNALSLTVVDPAIVTHPVAPASVVEGGSFTLSCSGTGVNPSAFGPVTSYWTVDDGSIDPVLVDDIDVQTSGVTATLDFGYMTSALSGDYKCHINYNGAVKTSDAVTISLAGIRFFPVHALVVDGESLTISSVAISQTSIDAVGWYKDGIQLHENDDITITKVEADEDGMKVTTTKLTWNNVGASNQDAKLHVEFVNLAGVLKSDEAALNVLEVYLSPQDYKILRGVDTYVYCSFEGAPQPAIEWRSHTSKDDTEGTPVTGMKTEITSQTFSLGNTVYQSRLTVNQGATAPPTYWSCRATYPSFSSQYVFSGGTLNTNIACLTPIGVTSVQGPVRLTVGSTATFVAKADSPPVPEFGWMFNGHSMDSIPGQESEQISSSQYQFVYEKTNMQVTDSGEYGALAAYTDFGSSGLVTIETAVLNACPRLAAPSNGVLTCTPDSYSTTSTTIPAESQTDTTVSCTVTCNNGYLLQNSKSVFACTDGVWEHNSVVNPTNKVTKCLRVVSPASYSLTFSIGYTLPFLASCTDHIGDWLRVTIPHFIKEFDSQLSCVQSGDCHLDETFFQYDNPYDACYNTGRVIWLQGRYVQDQNTNVDKRLALWAEFRSTVLVAPLVPDQVLEDANCLGTCQCCAKDSCIYAPSTVMSKFKCSSYESESQRKRRAAVEEEFEVFDNNVLGGGNVTDVVETMGLTCQEGTVPIGDQFCTACVEGTYQNGYECSSCPIGTYQDQQGTTTCRSCPEGTSTTSTGATDIGLCVQVCQMEDVGHGSSEPAYGWMVRVGDSVTVKCDPGFQFQDESISVIKMESCDVMPACSRVRIQTPSLTVLENEPVELTCQTTSTIQPELCLFYKGSHQINASMPISLGGGDYECKMRVLSAGPADEGEYSCKSVWEDDQYLTSSETSNHITIRVMSLTFDPVEVVYAEGSDHTFVCAAVVPPDTAVVISWTHNGQPVGERTTSTDNPALAILSLEGISPADQGEYQCRATYPSVGTITSDSAEVIVLGWLESLHDVDLTLGMSTELHCTPTEGTISWTLNSAPLTTTSNTLNLSSVGQQDAGVYRCVAEYAGQSVESTATINVYESGITQHPADVTVKSGEQATLTCTTNTDSVFTWYQDGEEVFGSSTSRQSVLTTSPLTTRANIQCVVTTEQSQTLKSKIGVVNVLGFKAMPQPKELSNDGETTLLCSVMGDGLTSLQWIRDSEAVTEGSNVEVYTTGHITTSVLTATETGSYHCVADFEGVDQIRSQSAAVTMFQISLRSEAVALGDDIVLTCTITGRPDIVLWTRNGEMFHTDSELSAAVAGSDSTTSQVSLTSVTTSDLGDYRCSACLLSDLSVHSSDPASLSLLGFVDVVSDVVVKRDYETEIMFSVRHQEGAEVSCDLMHGDFELGFGEQTGDVIKYRSTVNNIGDHITEIQYTCTVRYGDKVITSDQASIYILDEPVLKIADTHVLIGDVAKFDLEASYIASLPSVHWKVNRLLTVQYSDSYTNSKYKSSIQWPITQDIEVEATIHYEDVGGYSVQRAYIIAYGVESVTGPEEAHIGETYDLTCTTATIDQSTSVDWSKDGQSIPSTQTRYMSDNKVVSVLTISNVRLEDIGVYTCTAVFSDGKESSGAFFLTQTNKCKLPSVENAVFDSTLSVIEHLGELSVVCGEETVVIKCNHGVWDQTIAFCPAPVSALNTQILSIMVTLAIILIVGVAVAFFFFKKRPSRAVTPAITRADSVAEFKREWRNYAEQTDVIQNPAAERTENVEDAQDVGIARQYQNYQLERSVTQISG